VKRAAGGMLALLVAFAAVVGGSELWATMQFDQVPCPAKGTVVIVDAKQRFLCLCAEGAVEGTYRVAIGRGGLGKVAEGDDKTPIGSYRLSDARPSVRFGLFLPVGYPTTDQAKQGYTGSDVGIHGPHRAFVLLRHATVLFNWTAGCIAVGSRSDIETIARWVAKTGCREVDIIA
jgi:hypothetical protein